MFFVCWQGTSTLDLQQIPSALLIVERCETLLKVQMFTLDFSKVIFFAWLQILWPSKLTYQILNVDISIVYEIIFSKDTLSWNPKLEPVCHIHAWSQLGESWRYCLLLRSGPMFLFTEETILNTIISVELGIPKCGSKCGFTHHFWKATGVARVTLSPGKFGLASAAQQWANAKYRPLEGWDFMQCLGKLLGDSCTWKSRCRAPL